MKWNVTSFQDFSTLQIFSIKYEKWTFSVNRYFCGKKPKTQK